MIIYYRGSGGLVPVIACGFIFLVGLLVALYYPEGEFRAWIVGLGLMLAGVAVYPWGRRLNRTIDAAVQAIASDPPLSIRLAASGDKRHSLYGVRMEHWGIAMIIFGPVICLVSFLTGGLPSRKTSPQANGFAKKDPVFQHHLPPVIPPLPAYLKDVEKKDPAPTPGTGDTKPHLEKTPEQVREDLLQLRTTYIRFNMLGPKLSPERAAQLSTQRFNAFKVYLKTAAPTVHKALEDRYYALAFVPSGTVVAYTSEPDDTGSHTVVTHLGKVLTMTPGELRLGLGLKD